MDTGGEHQAGTRWSDDRTELLRQLWQDGLSAGQIAKRLGGLSRSAVIGKVQRLKLLGTRKPAAPPKGSRPRAPVKSGGRKAKPTLAIAGNGAVFEKAPPAALRVTSGNRVLPMPPDAPLTVNASAWVPLPGVTPVSILDLRHTHCRWPLELAHDDLPHFCGALAIGGVYCPTHGRWARPAASAKAWIDKRLGIPAPKGRAA